MITFTETDRHFTIGEFNDRYGRPCSIQKSSLATEDCIWLGCDELGQASGSPPFNLRMHLTREMAAELIKALSVFVDTGELQP